MRVLRDEVTISLDTSGAPLHRRGWRLAGAKAPLREDLAHALIRAAAWPRDGMLIDPMMGSGTIPIEAASLAAGLAPGRLRHTALEHTALMDREAHRQAMLPRPSTGAATTPPQIFGSDRDAGAVEAAHANAVRAGVAELLDLRSAPLRAAPVLGAPPPASATGSLVSNPPYGHRVGVAGKLTPLWQSLGHAARQLPPTWSVAVCTNDRRLALRAGLPWRTAFLTQHGGLKVRALRAAAGAQSEHSNRHCP